MSSSLFLKGTGAWMFGYLGRNGIRLRIRSYLGKHFPLLLSLTVLFSGLVNAQPEAALSLRQCIELALDNSPAIRSQARQVDAAAAQYREARSGYYPELSAAAGHQQFFREGYNYREQSAGVSLDWPLGDWLFDSAAPRAAEMRARQAALDDQRLMLTLRVAGLYGQILQTGLQQQQLRERQSLLNNHLQINRALWEAGVRSRLDLLQTQSAQALLRQEASRIAEQERVLQEALNRLLKRDADAPLALQPFPELPSGIDSLPPAPAQLYPLLSNTPLMRSLNLQIEAESLRREALRAARFPHLQLSGGFVADADPVGDGNYGRIGLEISLPLLQWGRSKFQNQAIRANIGVMEAAQAAALQELTIELDTRLARLTQLQQLLRLQQEQLTVTREASTLAAADYQAGIVTNLEFLAAQQDLSANRLQIRQTRLAIRLTLIDIYARTGQIEKINEITGE